MRWTRIAPVVGVALSAKAHSVFTTSGELVGHPATSATGVTEYLGIPYARPPVGDLRFAPPVPFKGTGVFDASSFSNACPYVESPGSIPFPNKTSNFDTVIENFTGTTAPLGEDCLTLNVWTKNTTTKNKGVLVFFYGGRFLTGNTNDPFYSGKNLAAAEDIVVVSVNYRLNIFGFPGAPGLTNNVALLDQRLAMEWLRDNVVAFNGSPDRIILSGHSVGGWTGDFQSFAFAEDPIFSGIISQSGTTHSFVPNSPALALRYWQNATVAAGCTTGDDAAILACMRALNFTDLLAAGASVPPVDNPNLVPAPTFHPTVDNKLVFANYTQLSAAGKFAKVPYLLGNADNEAGFYRILAFLGGLNITDVQWDNFIAEGFTCAAATTANDRVKFGVPTWRYRYFGDWDNMRLYPTSGAYHGTDIVMIFGTSAEGTGVPNSDAENQVTSLIQGAWGAFVKNPKSGLKAYGWPEYRLGKETLVRLAFENAVKASFVDPIVYDAPCAAFGGSVAQAQGDL